MLKAFFSTIALVFASLFGIHPGQPATTEPAATVHSPSSTPPSAGYIPSIAINPAPIAEVSPVAPPTIRSLATGSSTPAADVVTHAELSLALERLGSSLRVQLLGLSPSIDSPANSLPVSYSLYSRQVDSIFDSIAKSQRIDQLSNVTITNATVHGVSGLTAADIPSLNYLSATSGANDIDVFLIAGQSNAEGYNNTSSGPTITPGTAFEYYNGAISAANDPVGNASTGSAWPQFAISYYAKTGHRIALVPTAVPSSALLAAANLGTGYWGSGGTLFNTSVTQVSAALSAFQAAGYVPHFVGVLWDQGESDALAINGSIVTGPAFQTALQTLVGNYRAQFGANMPFYIFRTGTFTAQSDSGFSAVRNAEEAVAAGDRNTFIVFRNAIDFPTRGLMNGDGAHYTQAGYNEMGRVGAETIANRTSVPRWQDQSTSLVFDTSTGGRVGIGTTSPLYTLDVAGFINADQYSGFKQAGNTILFASTTNHSLSVGVGAGSALNAAGLYNTAVGENALAVATSSGLNTAVGVNALNANTTGNNNTAVGVAALYGNTTGINSVAIGVSALQVNSTGLNNVAVGYGALFLNSTGSGNIGVGTAALGNQTTGFGNIAIGHNTGNNITTGSNNILIGFNINATSSTATRSLNVGNLLFGIGLDGAGSTLSTGSIGVGTTTPWRKLSVTGTVGLDGLTASFGAGSLCLTANKEVVYNAGSDNCLSSLRATKHDINSLALAATSTIAALSPVSFVYNGDASSTVRYGFIAEDTAAVNQHLATYDQSGALTGVDDRAVLSVIVDALQELIATVAGFARNFATQTLVANNGTFKQITTDKLCVTKSDGSPVCITGDALDQILTKESVSPTAAPPASTLSAAAPSSAPSSPTASTSPTVDEATSSLPVIDPAPPLSPDLPAATPVGQPAATSTSQ